MKAKIGLIGLGYTIGIAKSHLNAYLKNEDCEIVALYDIVAGRTEEWLDKKKIEIEGVKHCSSYDELLSMVDGVSICTPNNTHEELAAQALEAGVHVLCEKPIAHTIESAKCMAENAEKYPELINMIGFCYRGIPAIRYMKEIIDEGKIGKIHGFRHCLGGGRIANPTDVKLEWRMQEATSGTGALADFGSHMLDLTEHLLSATEGKISEVAAFTTTTIKERNRIDGESKGAVTNDDTAAFMIRMEGGAVGTFYSSRVGINGQFFEIFGEGGMIAYMNDENKITINLKEKDGSYTKPLEVVDVPEKFTKSNKFEHEIDEFVDCIINNKKPDRDFKEGYRIQQALAALSQSNNTKTIKDMNF